MYRRSARGGVTGGSYPAQTWNAFMAIAHKSMDIPTIPGLPDHPTQVAERARLAQLRETDPSFANRDDANRNPNEVMPERTREVLQRLLKNLERVTAGEPTVAPQSEAPTGKALERRAGRSERDQTPGPQERL